MGEKYSVKIMTEKKSKTEPTIVRFEVKHKSELYNELPQEIRDKFKDLDFDICNSDDTGHITFFSYTMEEKTDHPVELDFALRDKGIEIEYLNDSAQSLYDELLKKLKYDDNKIKFSDYLYDYLDTYFVTYNSWKKTLDRLYDRISKEDAILFFAEFVNEKPKFSKVFKILTFNYKKRNYLELPEFNHVSGPINFVTQYKGETVPKSGFIIGKDFSWIYYFGELRLFVYSEFEPKEDVDSKRVLLHFGTENRK